MDHDRVAPLPPLDPEMDPTGNHYWSYHGLETLLACKRPVTASQDEDLFIAVHQICELAFHQMVLDLDRALDALRAALEEAAEGPLGPTEECGYFLRRVNRLWRTVNGTMPILTDLRAFGEFRDAIGPTSGFQSFQFRRLELQSGVPRYWTGGTADASGTPHVAETEFDRRYGAEIARWLERYRRHSLRHYFGVLVERAREAGAAEPVAALRADRRAAPLLGALADYDRAQLRFHRSHLQLATVQLERVGVDTGTGGTSFRDYLAKYERELAPLFPGLGA
ncbi:MAG: tryptophan 2,3-dioxygenase family protein [Pseudomonadales bacterium]|nr:tryptophan 2,3-dioxygenase family protein [Pseudomonadales bacterium]